MAATEALRRTRGSASSISGSSVSAPAVGSTSRPRARAAAARTGGAGSPAASVRTRMYPAPPVLPSPFTAAARRSGSGAADSRRKKAN